MAGCAGDKGRYPSLATRDFERVRHADVSAPLLTPGPAGAEALARAEQLLGEARNAHADFLKAAPGAVSAVGLAAGTTPDDNAWSAAQIELARLDSLRSLAAIALGDLDLLHAGASLDFRERDALGNARDQVVALVEEEDRTLARLRAIMTR